MHEVGTPLKCLRSREKAVRLGHGENVETGVGVEAPVRGAGKAEGAGLCRHKKLFFFSF